MGIFGNLFGRRSQAGKAVPEQAVLVYFRYGSTDLTRLFALEDKLEEAIANSRVGELDGHEISMDASEGTFFMYGLSADTLFGAIRPLLEDTEFTRSARVVLRYGPPKDGVRESVVHLGT